MSRFSIVTPVVITESQIISSNVLENEADEWVAGEYMLDDEVIFGTRLYVALETTTDQPDVGAAADPPSWRSLGVINRYRMFDALPAPQSIRAGNIDVTIDPGVFVGGIGLINVRGNSVTVQLITDEEGVVYSETRTLQDNTLITNWFAYFTEPITFRSDVVFLNLPSYAAQVRVFINAGGGTAALGELVAGRRNVYGDALYGTTAGTIDFSRISQDTFGNFDIVRRRFAKTCDYDIVIGRVDGAAFQRALIRTRGRASLFIGAETLEETIVYGLANQGEIGLQPAGGQVSLFVTSLPYEELEDVFTGGAVNLPTIIAPFASGTQPENAPFRASAFSASPDNDTHESTSWQWSASSDFTVPFYESLLDATNLTEITPPAATFVIGTDYWVRVLYNGVLYGESGWSSPVRFTAGVAVSVDTPTITFPVSAGTIAPTQPITSSAFVSTPSGTHLSSRWVISANRDMTSPIVDVTSETQLTSFDIPEEMPFGNYYVTVQYQNSFGVLSAESAAVDFTLDDPIGQQVFTSSGTGSSESFSFVVPAGVINLSAVAVGAGGGIAGGGGSLAYSDGFSVTPGETLTITVGKASNLGNDGGTSRIQRGGTSLLVAPGGRRDGAIGTAPSGTEMTAGHRGGRGGVAISTDAGGGGGAAGYTGVGGNAGAGSGIGVNGNASPADGGGGGFSIAINSGDSGTGGGVGLLGPGTGGLGGTSGSRHGTGGSGGTTGSISGAGLYGGGGARANSIPTFGFTFGGNGAVRLIWGSGRAYPSTRVADE